MIRHLFTATLIVATGALSLSCSVNQYCLNCETGDGGTGDVNTIDAADDATTIDAMVDAGGPCTPTGDEVCDGKDNDCDGKIDEGTLPGVGDPCDNQMGECMGAVKACVSGSIVCKQGSLQVPRPEICDNKDNDCNGMVDEGDPGGGAKCGTDVGECVAGVNHCVAGTVKCIGAVGSVGGQAEQCNGKDDDCDGKFDEGLTNLGQCGQSNVGACHFGQLGCVGGGVSCVGNQDPVFEICNNIDDDCDGVVDNGFNKQTDPQNCGMCGNKCAFAHANPGCAGGTCNIASCQAGYHNNNGLLGDGCEFGPCFSSGSEVCNGLDDDCNGTVDDNLTPPVGLCKQLGACAGSVPVCTGSGGWKCNYGPMVSTDINGNIIPETSCDGVDNDCDGIVDNNQPNKGLACTDSKLGACQGKGTFVCDAANKNGPAICNITMPGATPVAESCNGLDDDCDGVVDNGANTGNLAGQTWVTIPGSATQIMKFEASRPDATSTALGSDTVYACSKQGVQPWINITPPQAAAACSSIGARLCTETEWQTMCAREPTTTYPVNGPSTTTDYVLIEAENAQTNAPGTSGGTARTWANDQTADKDFSAATDLIATPNTGANVSAANAPSQSPRLDFQVNFLTTGNYFVWVRVYAQNGNDNTIYTGINATAPGLVASAALAPSVLTKWTWVVGAAVNVTTTGNKIVSVYMGKDGVRVDQVAISKDGVDLPPYDKDTWSYATNPKLPQPMTCNGHDFNAANDDILPTGSLASCYANGGGTNQAFDMSGNVKEITAPRSAGQNPVRGGSSNNTVDGLTCQLNFTLVDNSFFFPDTGFRCCR